MISIGAAAEAVIPVSLLISGVRVIDLSWRVKIPPPAEISFLS